MSEEKQKDLEITFDINIIDHLGVKLYSTVPPMIAELISNAWDSDAHNVYIDFLPSLFWGRGGAPEVCRSSRARSQTWATVVR